MRQLLQVAIGVFLIAVPVHAATIGVYNSQTGKKDLINDVNNLGQVTGSTVTVTSLNDCVSGVTNSVVLATSYGLLDCDEDIIYNPSLNVLTVGDATIGGAGDRISGLRGYIDFDDNGVGSTVFGASGGSNNEHLILDLETEENKAVLSSDTNINTIVWEETIRPGRLIVTGGTVQINWDVSADAVSFYKFEDDAATTTVTDSVGTNTGTATTTTDALSTEGILSNAFDFSTGNQNIDLGSSSTLKPSTGDFTVAFWINTSATGVQRIVGNRDAVDGTGYEVSLNGTAQPTFILDIGASSVSITGPSAQNDGGWHFLVAKRASGVLTLKCDDVDQGNPTGSGAGDISSADNMMVARTPLTAGQNFHGKIDNLLFISRATTDDEDTGMYNDGFGEAEVFSPEGRWSIDDDTISYYKLDDNSVTTVIVDEQAANNGTSTANASVMTTTGKLTRALTFSSTNYVDLGSSSTLKPTTGDFTVAFWFKTSTSGIMRLLGNRSLLNSGIGYDINMNIFSRVGMILDVGASSFSVTGTTILNDGNWHFVVAKRKSGVLELKIDDTVEGTPTGGTTADIGTQADNMLLGRIPLLPSSQTYSGQLDNVIFVNRATTDTEDNAMYNSGEGIAALSGSLDPPAVPNIIAESDPYSSSHELSTFSDLLIEGKIEVDGVAHFDNDIMLYDDELHVTGQIVSTGSVDFGDSTSFQIPNGNSPTIDVTGEIAIDTTSDQLVFYGKTTPRILTPFYRECERFDNLVAANDDMLIWNAQTPMTVTAVSCRDSGFSTHPIVRLEDDSGNSVGGPTSVTCSDTTGTAWTSVESNNSFLLGEGIRFDTTNTPAPTSGTQALICFSYLEDRS